MIIDQHFQNTCPLSSSSLKKGVLVKKVLKMPHKIFPFESSSMHIIQLKVLRRSAAKKPV